MDLFSFHWCINNYNNINNNNTITLFRNIFTKCCWHFYTTEYYTADFWTLHLSGHSCADVMMIIIVKWGSLSGADNSWRRMTPGVSMDHVFLPGSSDLRVAFYTDEIRDKVTDSRDKMRLSVIAIPVSRISFHVSNYGPQLLRWISNDVTFIGASTSVEWRHTLLKILINQINKIPVLR